MHRITRSVALRTLCAAPTPAALAMPAFARWAPRRFAGEEAKKEEAKKEEPKADGQAKQTDEVADLLKKKDAEIAELKSQALYMAAEAENTRRIARDDVAKAKDFGVTSFAKDMVDVVDTLERAIEACGKLPADEAKMLEHSKAFHAIVSGVKMSASVLSHNLARHGVEKMKAAVGDTFDPNKHDAIFNAPATDLTPPGSLANVVKQGYMLKERVLRPAQVGVAQKQD